jgi:hypothetical protein
VHVHQLPCHRPPRSRDGALARPVLLLQLRIVLQVNEQPQGLRCATCLVFAVEMEHLNALPQEAV